MGPGLRGHRHPDARRSGAIRQHDERPLQVVHGRSGEAPCSGEGKRPRSDRHLGEEDVLRRRRSAAPRAGGPRASRFDVEEHPGDDRTAPRAGDARRPRRRGAQRFGARGRSRDCPRLPPAHRDRRPEVRVRIARGDARPLAGRQRHRSHRPPPRHPEGVAGRAHPGPAHAPRAGGEGRGRRRARERSRRHDGARSPVHPRQRERAPALGRRRLQDARRHTGDALARDAAPRVPREPEEAAPRREHARPEAHHGCRRRGRPDGLRQRGKDRDALLHRARDRQGVEEHDPGVLLRPAEDQRRRQPTRRGAAVAAEEGRHSRRRHDGQRHRLRHREGGYSVRAEGRHAGKRREGQELLAKARGEGGRPRRHDRRGREDAARPHRAHHETRSASTAAT